MKLNHKGMMSSLLLPVIFTILFLGAAGFGVWAFSERNSYKNDVDAKVQKAVEIAVQKANTVKDNEFIEKEKEPLVEYKTPSALGSASLMFPKTWSAYVDETTGGGNAVNAFFHPSFVPGEKSGVAYALRFQVVNSGYDQVAKTFEQSIEAGKITAQAYQHKAVPGSSGLYMTGEIITAKKGIMVLLPLRDKTIKIWTEAEQFSKDFNDIVLPKLTFNP